MFSDFFEFFFSAFSLIEAGAAELRNIELLTANVDIWRSNKDQFTRIFPGLEWERSREDGVSTIRRVKLDLVSRARILQCIRWINPIEAFVKTTHTLGMVSILKSICTAMAGATTLWMALHRATVWFRSGSWRNFKRKHRGGVTSQMARHSMSRSNSFTAIPSFLSPIVSRLRDEVLT
jgi:hypothetical protein